MDHRSIKSYTRVGPGPKVFYEQIEETAKTYSTHK